MLRFVDSCSRENEIKHHKFIVTDKSEAVITWNPLMIRVTISSDFIKIKK